MKIICIGNYPPRKCGIATFTENLVKSIIQASADHSLNMEVEVIAMNDHHQNSPSTTRKKRITTRQQDSFPIRGLIFVSYNTSMVFMVAIAGY